MHEDPEPGPQLDAAALDVEDRIVAAIRRLIRAVDMRSRRLVDECGLTGPQLVTLRLIAKAGSISATALARAAHLSGATMTGILRRLEARNLLERTRGTPDRRTVIVELTSAGHAILGHTPSLLQDQFRDRLSQLPEWERLMLLANLQRIAGLMDAGSLDAAPHLELPANLASGPTTASAGDPILSPTPG